MLNQVLRTALRASTKVVTQQLTSYRVSCAANLTVNHCRGQWNIGRSRYSFISRGARHLCSRIDSDKSDSDAGDLHPRDAVENSDDEDVSDDENSDGMSSDHDIFEAFQSELALNDVDDEEMEDEVAGATQSNKMQPRDDHGLRPWKTKERMKACLDKLQKGPDGRYINVFEVATELDMLIASYVKLRKQDDPDRADNSDDDEKYIEGIDIEKFKRLQRRLRDGTYEFQPIINVPLPKRKVVKLKTKKVKKHHAF